MITITTGSTAGWARGDLVRVRSGNRWRDLRALLGRPRVRAVVDLTATTLIVVERRMTWREYFDEILFLLRA